MLEALTIDQDALVEVAPATGSGRPQIGNSDHNLIGHLKAFELHSVNLAWKQQSWLDFCNLKIRKD